VAEGFSGHPLDGSTETVSEQRGEVATANWLTSTRNGVLTICASVVGVALLGVLAWHFFVGAILTTPDAIAAFVGAMSLLVLPILLLGLDANDNMGRGPKLTVPVSTLLVLTIASLVALADRTNHLHIFEAADGSPQIIPLLALFAFVVVAFIPRIWNAARFAEFKQREIDAREADAMRKRQQGDKAAQLRAAELSKRTQEQDDAEALGAFVATAIVAGIIALAWFAGSLRDGMGLRNGVGVTIAACVIALFAIVIFLDWIAEAPPIRAAGTAVRGFSRRVSGLANFYNTIDAVLVRIGAHAAGMEHRQMGSRYLVLAGTMLTMAILAWNLPAPIGLIPAAIGLLLALSVSRLWSWVEDDRNLASITRFNPDAPIKVGFREDFRDETLLGFVFVLVIIPIALMQADKGIFGLTLFHAETPEAKGNLDLWLGYYGFELAKALPVIDWADIYKLQPGDDLLRPNGAMGMHAVFAARVAVDLVLIASLLQAISIATRNRQQKALFSAGHINRLDELVEKEEIRKALNRRRADWFKGNLNFRRYDRERLKQIYYSSTAPRERTFIETIFTEAGENLDSAINVLRRLVENHGSEDEIYRTLDAVRSEHASGAHKTTIEDLILVLSDVRSRSGLKDFKFALLKMAREVGSPYEVADMLELVMFGAGRDTFQYTRIEAAKLLTAIAPELPVCSQIQDLIGTLEREGPAAFGATRFVPDALLTALKQRADDLGCAPAASESHENKP
jgi:hypothetical protein